MNDHDGSAKYVIPDRLGSVLYQFYLNDYWTVDPVIAWHVVIYPKGENEYTYEPNPITVASDGYLSEIYCIEIRVNGLAVRWEFPYDRSFTDAAEAIEYGKQQRREYDARESD